MASSDKKKASGVVALWKSSVNLLLSEPKILLPFGILAVVESIALYILACSPHFPVNIVLAPPIRRIWGSLYLHYPFIYELLPRMFYYAKMVVGVFVGSVTAGMAVSVIYLSRKKKAASLKDVLFSVLRHYVSLFLLITIIFVCVHFLMHQPALILARHFRSHPKLLSLGPKFWFDVFVPGLGFLLAVLFQGIFVYAIPYVVIKGRKFLSALLLGIGLFSKIFLKTIIAVAVPMLLYVPVTILRNNFGFLAEQFSPEAIVLVLFLGILVGTVIVDCLITTTTTLLFIEVADEA